MTPSCLLLCAAVTAGMVSGPAEIVEQPAPVETLPRVLARAAEYVVDFERDLSGIVSEETYVQDAYGVPVFNGRGVREIPHDGHRELKSDLLLVRPVGSNRWVQFRDVFDVDGKPVRDRSDRLAKLFLNPTSSTSSQLRDVVNESARYNIGKIARTINVPLLPLEVLEPGNQARFKFQRAARDPGALVVGGTVISPDLPKSAHFVVSTEVWTIAYKEVEPGTIIRTTKFRDLPSRGRFWIEPATGRVLMSELVAEDHDVRGQIDVSYQSVPVLGLLVPVEMHEVYEGRDGVKIEGTATYGNFRRFQVKVDERMAPVPEKK